MGDAVDRDSHDSPLPDWQGYRAIAHGEVGIESDGDVRAVSPKGAQWG
jgi:hypothetical protein